MNNNYFCKPDYQPNLEQTTADSGDTRCYWNADRVAAASRFQYYVYLLCQDLIRANGLRSVLDVGCGPATKVKQLVAPLCSRVVLIDQPSTRELVEEELPDAEFHGADLETMNLMIPKQFDLIVCADVLEHLVDPNPCSDFIRNHLAPGGFAVLSTPERDFLRGKSCTQSPHPQHVREWNSQEFAAYLADRGFEIVNQKWFPSKRLGRIEYQASRMLGRFMRKQKWSSCQVAVCRG